MGQNTFYPEATIEEACLQCYSGESTAGCKPNFGNFQNSQICPTVCNTKCNTVQAYCQIGIEHITSHADTDSWSGFPSSDIISYRWTAGAWNDLQTVLEEAGQLGLINSVGSPHFTRACSGEIVTANYYNEWDSAARMFRTSVGTVNKDVDVIRNSHSAAIENLLQKCKFASSTCDICNASVQRICSYDCNCNYDCYYNCNYNCQYDCYHDCYHDCGTDASD